MSAQRIPLAPSQRGLYFLHQFAPDSAAYNVPVALRVRGPLSLPRLQDAVDALTQRHQALRTTFADEHGWPVQVIHPPQEAPRVTVSAWPISSDVDGDPATAAAVEAEQRAAVPFDLVEGPLWRVGVVPVGAHDHLLTLTFDHIVIDETSIGVLAKDLRDAYADAGSLPAVEPARSYAECCRYDLDHPDADGSDYWRENLRGAQTRPLPPDPVGPAAAAAAPFAGRRLRFRVDESTAKRLPTFCAQQRATPFAVFHAAFTAVLHGWTGDKDILVGTAVQGRPDDRFAETVGFFQNTVVLRSAVEPGHSFAELMASGRTAILNALQHRRTPFESVVEIVRPARGGTSNPLFQAALGYNRIRIDRGWLLDGLDIEPVAFDWPITQFDLNLFLQQDGGAILGEITFNPTRFRDTTMLRLAAAFGDLLAAVVADARLTVGELPRLPETALPVRPARRTRIPLSYAQRGLWFLHHLEETGAAYTVALAVQFDEPADVTALGAALADVAARHEALRTVFVQIDGEPGQVVRDAAEHDPPLAIVEATDGGLDEVLHEAARCRFELTGQPPARATLFTAPGGDTLLLVLHRIVADEESLRPLARDLGRAYAARRAGSQAEWPQLPVQYTDFVLWQQARLGTPDDPADDAIHRAEFWRKALRRLPDEPTLPCGRARQRTDSAGSVPLSWDAEVHAAVSGLARACGTTVLPVVQAAVAALLSRVAGATDIPLGTLTSGRGDPAFDDVVGCFANPVVLRADVSGDPTFRELLQRVRDSSIAAEAADLPFDRVVAAVNPARTPSRHPLFSVAVSLTREVGDATAPFSAELLSTAVAPLDLSIRLSDSYGADGVPVGLRGAAVYAADRFDRASIVALVSGLETLLRQAGADPDGRVSTLEIGEASQGLERVDPADPASTVLAAHPWVADVAMVNGVAYVVPTAVGVTEGELRAYFADRLPARSAPALVRLGGLPRTGDGRLDLAALPPPAAVRRRHAPSTPTERLLHKHFVRAVGRVGVDDDFFAAGGDSLRALRLVVAVGRELAVRVPVSLMYARPTVAGLAAELDARARRGEGSAL